MNKIASGLTVMAIVLASFTFASVKIVNGTVVTGSTSSTPGTVNTVLNSGNSTQITQSS